MYYTGSFSRYTLYTSLENRKKKLFVCLFVFCSNSLICLRASTPKQSTADTRLQVALFSLKRKTFFLWFGQWRCWTFSHVLMHLLMFICPFHWGDDLKRGTVCWSTVQRKGRRPLRICRCPCATSHGTFQLCNMSQLESVLKSMKTLSIDLTISCDKNRKSSSSSCP